VLRQTMTQQPPHSRSLRVLCLHGYRQNREILHNKTFKNFRERCLNKLGIEYVYPPSVHKMEEASKEEGADVFKWWDTDPPKDFLTGGNATIGIAETLQMLAAWIVQEEAKNGRLDGVFGYSQGGLLASLLCAAASTVNPSEEPFAKFPNGLGFGFKFGIFFCVLCY